MNDSFFAYLHRLELIAFFSGYPLIYALVLFITGTRQSTNDLKKTLISLLPFSYALVGTLYLGFELKNLYPDYSIDNLRQFALHPYLVSWAILALLFWMPALAKKPVLSLLHSIVFFVILIRDLFFQVSVADKSVVRNDMKLYTASLLLTIISYITVALIYLLFKRFKTVKKSFPGVE